MKFVFDFHHTLLFKAKATRVWASELIAQTST